MIAVGRTMMPSRSFIGVLHDIFPKEVQLLNWKGRFLPVADSAEMQRAVGEMLNFDQAAFAQYTQGSFEVSIYAAYWSPGKMSHRLIAAHTPDVCWVGAGWERMEARQIQLSGVNMQLTPGVGTETREELVATHLRNLALTDFYWEYREFNLRGRMEYVIFLHLVGGRAMNYGVIGLPPWYSVLQDLAERGLRQREEQFFVRISGNRPLPEIISSEPIRRFLVQFESEAFAGGLHATQTKFQ